MMWNRISLITTTIEANYLSHALASHKSVHVEISFSGSGIALRYSFEFLKKEEFVVIINLEREIIDDGEHNQILFLISRFLSILEHEHVNNRCKMALSAVQRSVNHMFKGLIKEPDYFILVANINCQFYHYPLRNAWSVPQ